MKNNDALIRFRDQVAKLWWAGYFFGSCLAQTAVAFARALRMVLDGRDPYDGEQRP